MHLWSNNLHNEADFESTEKLEQNSRILFLLCFILCLSLVFIFKLTLQSKIHVFPRSKDSMYHALGYSTILVMQAAMTFEQQDIQMGISTMKDALQTCQR